MPSAIASGSLTATIGWSEHADGAIAGKEAAESARKRLSSLKPKLALVFGSSWLNQAQLVEGIQSVVGQIPLAGESTAGEITPQGPVTRHCVVVLVASEALLCSVGVGERVDRAPRAAGQQAARAALQGFPGGTRAGFLLFGDGLVTGYEEAVRGVQEIVGTSTLIAGGMAGDDQRFTQTYQYANHQVVSRAVVGVLLGGPVKLGTGIEHGFAPISTPRRITRARGTILYELDQQPAASLYEEYLGPELVQRMRGRGPRRGGIAYPLGIQPEGAGQWLLRNVVSFGEDGSLSCSGEIPQNAWLQLMIGNRELALEAARKAAQQAIRPLTQVGCVLVFDSAIRRTLLGSQHAALEIARIREVVGVSTPLAGCYTYGEQAPFGATAAAGPNGRAATQTGSVLVVALGT